MNRRLGGVGKLGSHDKLYSWPCQKRAHHRFQLLECEEKSSLVSFLFDNHKKSCPGMLRNKKGMHSIQISELVEFKHHNYHKNCDATSNAEGSKILRRICLFSTEDFRGGCYLSLWQVNVLTSIAVSHAEHLSILHYYPKTSHKFRIVFEVKRNQCSASLPFSYV